MTEYVSVMLKCWPYVKVKWQQEEETVLFVNWNVLAVQQVVHPLFHKLYNVITEAGMVMMLRYVGFLLPKDSGELKL